MYLGLRSALAGPFALSYVYYNVGPFEVSSPNAPVLMGSSDIEALGLVRADGISVQLRETEYSRGTHMP
jgi:hypothetical protein